MYDPLFYSERSQSEMARLQDAVEMAYRREMQEEHAMGFPETDRDRFERLALGAKPQLDRLMVEFGTRAENPQAWSAYDVLLTYPEDREEDEGKHP